MKTLPKKVFPYQRWLIISALCIVVIMGVALGLKFSLGGYNGLDLAIYNQVMWHSVHGDWFGFTIHPHSYLGDHLELILLAIVPLYAFLQSPLTLILVQAGILVAAVWPLWHIARTKLTPRWSFVLCLAWLLSPFLHSIASFEFHALAFMPFFVLWTIYFYQKQRWWLFVAFFMVSLTIREDSALVLIGFSALAMLEKRSWHWRLFPIIAGLLWFIVALKVSPLLTGYPQYKFLVYYGWLGSNPLEMLTTVINHPWYVIQNVITFKTIIFMVGLGVPYLFLHTPRPKYLILISIPLLQYVLTRNPGELMLQTHYVAPLLAPLFVATIDGLSWLHTKPRPRLAQFFSNEPGLVQTVLLTATIGSLILIGPVRGFITETTRSHESEQLRDDIVAVVPTTASVAAGYSLITDLSSREKVYSLHYQFLGKRQFSEIEYRLPDDTEYAILNADDSLIYHVAYEETDPKNLSGDDRLREFFDPAIRGCTAVIDSYALYQKNAHNTCELFVEHAGTPQILATERLTEKLSFVGWESNAAATLTTEQQSISGNNYRVFPLTTYWRADQKLDRDYSFKLLLKRAGQSIYEKRYPFHYGLFVPTSWNVGENTAVTYRFLLPAILGETSGLTVELQVELLDGRLWLDNWRGVGPTYDSITPIGEPISIGSL